MASAMAGQLQDKVALITGAGRGIGVGIANVLVERGAAVAVCDIDGAAAQETADAIVAAGGVVVAIGGYWIFESYRDTLVEEL